MPPTTALGPFHVPPAWGVPVNPVDKTTDVPSLHTVKVPLVPALAATVSVTVAVAVEFAQGAVPVTVYV